MAFELVQTIEVGAGGIASIEFASIPQDGSDLLILSSSRNSGNGALVFYFNNDTTNTNYSRLVITSDGSSANTFSQSLPIFGLPNNSTYTASVFANSYTYIPQYTNSLSKTVSAEAAMENYGNTSLTQIIAGRWAGTAPISSIKINTSSGDHTQYSTFSLYKIS